MIGKLKMRNGSQYTSKLEGMSDDFNIWVTSHIIKLYNYYLPYQTGPASTDRLANRLITTLTVQPFVKNEYIEIRKSLWGIMK